MVFCGLAISIAPIGEKIPQLPLRMHNVYRVFFLILTTHNVCRERGKFERLSVQIDGITIELLNLIFCMIFEVEE